MAAPINFESVNEKERKRKELREARHHYLEEAKSKYEKKEKKKEQARLRGEDTWMLPSVSQRVEQDSQSVGKSISKKSKKDKKKKKHKEKKKKKKKDDSSDSSSDSDEASWVEKPREPSPTSTSAVKGPRLERDSWMEAPIDLFPTVTRKDLIASRNKEKEEQEKQKALFEKPGQHVKELNPFWRDGGTGLPEDQKTSEKSGTKSSGVKAIGDGGISWLRKSYQRVVEQAKEEGRRLEDLAAERWGSLEKIQSMLREADSLAGKTQRGQGYGERKPWQRSKFAKPTDEDDSSSQDRRKFRRSHSRSPDQHSSKRRRSRDKSRSQSPRRQNRQQRRSRSQSPSKERSQGSHNRRSRDDRSSRRRSRSQSIERSSSSRNRRDSRSSSRDRRSRSRDRMSRSHAQLKDSKNDSRSTSSRFIRPGDVKDDEPRKYSSVLSSSNRVPAWKKQAAESTQMSETGSSKTKGNRRESTSNSESSSDSSSDSSERHQEQIPQPEVTKVKLLTEKEMNDLGAKILKAELMGNQAQADKLKAQLEAAREVLKNHPVQPSSQPQGETGRQEPEDEVVVLTRTDRSGMARPVPDRKHPAEHRGGRRKKQKAETHTGAVGERTKYFDDDDKFDLKTLVEREKMGTAEDQNQMFARLAGRSTEKTNDDFQLDDMFISKANNKQSASIQEERERAQAIFEHKKMASALEKCQFCFGNIPKHLIISIGTKAYLSLPNHRSLTEGHCLIIPMQHTASSTSVDEDVWNEIQVFRKCLTNMFSERDEDVVFMETSMGLKRFPHMTIECIPMEKEVGDLAPIYFKKAIMDSETEWSQNKKVVDISKKDIRRAVPKGFPYFAVDFGLQGGFAHVIEDEQIFPSYFGKEIIGGMIDVEPRLWRKPMKENFDDQRKKVMKFAEMWKPYDWTQKLAQPDDDSD